MPRRAGRDSFALVATLALVAVATLLLVLFVTATSSDRSASYTYSQSVKADQIARGGLHMIVGQLQAEMYKDGMPDTNNGAYPPIFTNIVSYNLLPQATVTNAALPSLVKTSTNVSFFVGTNSTVTADDLGLFQTSTSLANSSTTPSLNSRSVSTNIWNEVYLGQYPNAASAPYWVPMTRSGAANAATVSFNATTGNTVNNPAMTNPNYVVGRVAFAIYDEGGLLDVTAAGAPTSLSTAQLAQIKGTLAGADLTQVGITSPNTFVQWRNATSASSASTYLSFVTNFASTNGFEHVAPGDTTFLSRQDLIKAAQNGVAGLNTAALPNLTTFTRELNAPSWAPSLSGSGASTTYNYVSNANNLTGSPFASSTGKQNPNPYIPLVRYKTGGTVTGYLASGLPYTYTVNAGDPVVQHRFPLDRLNWITPTGPATMTTATPAQMAKAIQACFGLVWSTSENQGTGGDRNWIGIKLWKYVGPTASNETSTSNSPVETLSDVAKEGTPREPNFFELLQAGILSGSLGQVLGPLVGGNQFQFINNQAQVMNGLQLLRIGANILSQVQTQAYPINIEFNSNGYSNVASGVANLPYLNVLKFISGVDGLTTDSTTNPNSPMATYGLISLWNPHQQSASLVARPNVRLYVQGSVALGSGWCYGSSTSTPIPNVSATYGSIFTFGPTFVQLVNTPGLGVGVNGFQNPFAITAADVANASPAYSSLSTTTPGWTSSTSALTYQSTSTVYADASVNYEALQFPDVYLNLIQTNSQAGGNNIPGGTGGQNTALSQVHFDCFLSGTGGTAFPSTASPIFQLVLKYQDPNDASGNTWVPYDYWSGDNSWQNWMGPFTLGGPGIGLPTTTTGSGSTAVTTTQASTYQVPTVDQVMHSTPVASVPNSPSGYPATIRNHSGTLLEPAPLSMRPGIFPMSGDHSSGTNTGDLLYPLINSIWSGSSNDPDFKVAGYGGGASGGSTGIPAELNNAPADYNAWFYPAFLSRNNTPYPNVAGGSPSTDFTAYPDPDGIQRIADSGLFPTTSPTVQPAVVSGKPNSSAAGNPYFDPNDTATIATGQRTGDRPIILNRPFASVGELGYVCRDDPWRSLDFFSVFNGASTSADSGLLDLFTMTDSPNPVIAGRVNLNTKNPLVLQAILSGTLADPVGNVTSLANPPDLSSPQTMANDLVTYTSSTTTPQALVNKEQLVTKFNPTLPAGGASLGPFSNADEENVKFCREAFVRSLADVGQTRTWNLLIDIVAQAGKYPATAQTLDQFNVEGQRHYWLHVAIDRVTGKVIDQQLELVEP